MADYNEQMTGRWELRIRSHEDPCPIAYFNLHDFPQRRYERARAELIAATKALHPDVTDWRTVMDEDEPEAGNTVGLFMMLGHKPREARS